MAKLRERPQGYKPLLEIVLRQKREGGRVLSPGKLSGPTDSLNRRSCVVMVHGFNNNDGEAAHAYDGFRKRQIETLGASLDELNARLGDAFWPGDADWSWFDFVDFGVYSAAVGHAHAAATELTALILSMPSLVEIDFIGHSLGCRVILETLHHLRQSGRGPVVRRVCLMAAAVPMEKVEPGGDFHALLADLSANGTKILVLHSRQDVVLHYAFGAGQALAGPGERSSRALGREGPSPLIPGYRATLDDLQMGGANHGDYWGHSGSGISRESAKTAGRFLGLGKPKREVGTVRTIAFAEPGFPRRRAFG